MRRVLYIGAIALALIVIWLLSVLLPVAGTFQTLKPKLVEVCTSLDVFPGTEDIAIDHATGLAFVSATDRRTDRGGGIFLIDLDNPVSATRVSPPDQADFHPHGISLWHGTGSETRLFAISHASNGDDTVEIFDVAEGGSLSHLESISFPAMYSPNDLLAVGPRQFYASNDRGEDTGLIGTLEPYFGLPLSSAVYYDGTDGRRIKKGLVTSNGINQSLDGKTIYIAEPLKRRIKVYDRDISTGELTRRATIKVNTAPDNIDVDQDGTIWVAGHSEIFKFLAHAQDAAKAAPSHVVKIDPDSHAVEDVFISIDGEINASSVGAVLGDTLLVGAVFDSNVMICPLP